MKRRPVHCRLDFCGVLDRVTGDQINGVPLALADDVGVFGVLLASIGQDFVPDRQPVFLQRFAVERRRKTDEHVHVPVAGGPGPPSRRADLHHFRVDR